MACTLGALWAMVAALEEASIAVKGKSAHYVFVFDHTMSQMVEDYFDERGKPLSRLAAAKNATRGMIAVMPPHSRVMLIGFNGYGSNVMVFLPPTSHERRARIERGLELIDWWNAWESDSSLQYLPGTLYKAMKDLSKPLNLVIFSDGDSESYDRSVDMGKHVKDVRDFFKSGMRVLVAGVGKSSASEVPAFDRYGKKIGCFPNKYQQGQCFSSKLNEMVLQKSAQAMGGMYRGVEEHGALREWIGQPLTQEGVIDRKVVESRHFALLGLFLMVLSIIL